MPAAGGGRRGSFLILEVRAVGDGDLPAWLTTASTCAIRLSISSASDVYRNSVSLNVVSGFRSSSCMDSPDRDWDCPLEPRGTVNSPRLPPSVYGAGTSALPNWTMRWDTPNAAMDCSCANTASVSGAKFVEPTVTRRVAIVRGYREWRVEVKTSL